MILTCVQPDQQIVEADRFSGQPREADNWNDDIKKADHTQMQLKRCVIVPEAFINDIRLSIIWNQYSEIKSVALYCPDDVGKKYNSLARSG